MRRILLAAGSGGSFTTYFAPTDASWTRSGSNPIISATVAWEETGSGEPRVHTEGSAWKMWYNGGWTNEGQGYATSTDGISWAKYVSNPVYGQGGSGVSGWAVRGFVYLDGSTYYLYTSTGTNGPNFSVATSSDGIAWTTQSSSATLPSGKTLWGNRAVWKEGTAWKMLQEAGTSWAIYLYTSTDGLSWAIGNGGSAVSGLQVSTDNFGGPTIAMLNGIYAPKISGVYHIWYHDGPGSTTDIYHATSSDLTTWTRNGPVLTHAGTGFEIDQVADPSVLIVGATAYLFYTGVDNAGTTSKIGLATAPAVPA